MTIKEARVAFKRAKEVKTKENTPADKNQSYFILLNKFLFT